MLPAVAGETVTHTFRCGPLTEQDDPTTVTRAVEREGPLSSITGTRPKIFLFSLPETDTNGLGFYAEQERETVPEIWLYEHDNPDSVWSWRKSLMGEEPDSLLFTLEDGMWQRVVAYRRHGVEIVHNDYATNNGYTIRFGDGEFGATPVDETLFDVTYRLGAGSRANLAADIITAQSLPQKESNPKDLSEVGSIETVTNPFAVTNGLDPESAEEIKQLTPEAYQSETLFAVRPDDYGRQSEKLDWVQRAHGSFRWTGSWHSVIVSADPLDAHQLSPSACSRF